MTDSHGYGLTLFDRLRLASGILRSLRIYYTDRKRHSAMDRLYSLFARPNDLVFDIGAHVGDRIAAFRRIGCRIVAAEPQPDLVRLLRVLYGWRRGVTVVGTAVGAQEGTLMLNLNLANPTVATGSHAFITAARDAEGWYEQAWTRQIAVPVTTLDSLMARYGEPSFIKIDVEGLEEAVLAGLHHAVPALSFEFTTIQRDVALQALTRCAAIGAYRFNAALGESQRLEFAEWKSADEIAVWLAALPQAANSGDIYAALTPPTIPPT